MMSNSRNEVALTEMRNHDWELEDSGVVIEAAKEEQRPRRQRRRRGSMRCYCGRTSACRVMALVGWVDLGDPASSLVLGRQRREMALKLARGGSMMTKMMTKRKHGRWLGVRVLIGSWLQSPSPPLQQR